MPIVKQPSKLITASGHKKFSKQETAVFKLLLEENKASEIAKIMRLDEKTIGTYKLRLLQKTGAKTIIGLYLFNEKYKLVSLKQPA
jgi:DNA-binding NarL/FixJ family response regulator